MPDPDPPPDAPHPVPPGPTRADFAVGIVAHNHGQTIGDVVRASRAALDRVVGPGAGAIILADAGSSDGTVDLARHVDPQIWVVPYQVPPTYPFVVAYDGLPAKGTALRAIFTAAQQLDVRAVVVVGGNLQPCSPEALAALGAPALAGEFDFVAAWHARHRYEGLLTGGIVAPLLRALYGFWLRDPIGGEFALSRRFIDHALAQPGWEHDLMRVGVDGWLATEAMCGGFKIAQVATGPRAHVAPPGLDTSGVLIQVLAPIFAEMPRRAAVWQRVRGSQRVATIGTSDAPRGDVAFPLESTLEAWRLGYQSLLSLWAQIISPAALVDLKRLARAPVNAFRWPDDLWARIVYDFALAYRLRVMPRDHLLGALTPLYLGWAASFVVQVRELDAEQIDPRLDQIGQAFERQKPYLIARWRWPDRFTP